MKFEALSNDCYEWEAERDTWGCWGGGAYLPNENVLIDSDMPDIPGIKKSVYTQQASDGSRARGNIDSSEYPALGVQASNATPTPTLSSQAGNDDRIAAEDFISKARLDAEILSDIETDKNTLLWVMGLINALKDLKIANWVTSLKPFGTQNTSCDFSFDVDSKTIWNEKHGLGYRVRGFRGGTKQYQDLLIFTWTDPIAVKKLLKTVVASAMKQHIGALDRSQQPHKNTGKSSSQFAEKISETIRSNPNVISLMNSCRIRQQVFQDMTGKGNKANRDRRNGGGNTNAVGSSAAGGANAGYYVSGGPKSGKKH